MARGRHRLYVNGGMRSAAGVGVGDTASFALLAVSPGTVNAPGDVATALRNEAGAMAAFEALPPSHRQELLRYVDDARTAQTRERRIQKTIEHVLGKPTPSDRRRPDRPLWTCPNCGNEFVNKNQYHSCNRYTLASLFEGKPDHIKTLFDRFRDIVEACGPVKVVAYHDSVGFMVRVRFARAVPKKRWLDIGFWLTKRVEDVRFHEIETLDPNTHVHLLRVTEVDQLDDQVSEWTRDSYAVGHQEHLA